MKSLGEGLGDKKQFFEEEVILTYFSPDLDFDIPCCCLQNVNKVPLNYQGTPTDVASIVSYLASPESRFITGEYGSGICDLN